MSKKQPKLTPWFSPGEKPSLVGCYQTEDDVCSLNRGSHGYQWWNGKGWGYFELSAEAAERDQEARSSFQNNYWRGLAVKP